MRAENPCQAQIIAFWFEYLTRQRLHDGEDVLLVPGSISYLLANSGALGNPPSQRMRSRAARSALHGPASQPQSWLHLRTGTQHQAARAHISTPLAPHLLFRHKPCSRAWHSMNIVGCVGPTEARLVSEPLRLSRRRLVLFAVNDNPFVDLPGGGTHWTLLAYSSPPQSFWHFDSSAGGAHSPAAAAAAHIVQAVGPYMHG